MDLIFGDAGFSGAKTVEVRTADGAQETISAKYIFINTGTRASHPKMEGLDCVPTLDNASIMELEILPDHLLVLGGGYIGLKFAQLLRRFGSRVTTVDSSGQLLVA